MADLSILNESQKNVFVQLVSLEETVKDESGKTRTVSLSPTMAMKLAAGGKYPARGLKPHESLQNRISDILGVSDFYELVEESGGGISDRVSRETIQIAKDLFGRNANKILAAFLNAIRENQSDPASYVSTLVEHMGEDE